MPELCGKYDPRNPSHKMLMSMLGGMSESERQHVQARVRAAMDAQVVNEGRHQGGRAPYGYVTVDGGPHPNPRKAVEGFRLRVLTVDEPCAEVVRRIFAEYLDGKGDRAIANALNREGVLCPSARRPEQNRHRLADGWQGSTVRTILENPKYTGYAVFGRWTKQEMLIDPDDVSAGNITRFRRAPAERIVRSRMPAHPEIVSVELFTEVQLLRRAKAAGGLEARRKLERGPRETKHVYALRGRVRCGYCERRMEGTPRSTRIYYRCAARSIVPGSPVLATHPKNVYLPELPVVDGLNEWLGHLFAPPQREDTVRRLLGVVPSEQDSDAMESVRRKLADAKTRLRRLQAAIEAGANPTALVDALNRAQEERDAAQVQIDATPTARAATRAEIDAMIDHLADLGRSIKHADPVKLRDLYEAVDLQMVYDAEGRTVDVTIRPGRGSERVRGGRCALSTRLHLSQKTPE
ncbi:recombinase family protein [Actinokineospora sp. NBRC 105648]|uniref:recombinase family protein n=1 Tax=Actinokineospora sp. NBRC 105648 TaxID=3032206 RepID=UPI0024A1EDB1|nr:recombinase family protein [Actinokineospora sp. NBRC 105648]GLZ37152.1 recombinase [Actinokineospora sp. NBRC 105648]